MKPRAMRTPMERLVRDLFFGFCEVTVMLTDGTVKRVRDWPEKIAEHIMAGHLISPYDIGDELSWLILEVDDRAEAREIVAFMRRREFPSPIRIRDGSSSTLIWRAPYFKKTIYKECDAIRRGMAEMWPSVNTAPPKFIRLDGFVDDPNSGAKICAGAFLNLTDQMRDQLDGWVEETPWMHTKRLPDGRIAIRFGRRERFA